MSKDNQIQNSVSEETLKAFHLMWDPFPHSVLLLKKSRTIVDANAKALNRGVVLGKKCYALGKGSNGVHPGCLADEALEAGEARRIFSIRDGRVVDAYWLPITGEEDLFIHFTIYSTEKKEEEQQRS